MSRFLKTAVLFACLAIGLGTGLAQGPVGTLNGTILDPTGAVVPGATVVAVNNATGVESKTTSTSAGAYTLPYLPAGTYTVRASAPNFKTSTAENVILRVAQDLTLNISLQVGTVSQQVTVSDQAPLIDTGTSEIGRYISVEEYKSVPNFTSKFGTNGLHGTAFYYNQNEALNALSLQNKTSGGKKSRHREDNYGYSVGGPVYIPKVYDGRNKTFFFTNLERTKENDLR